ncbi:hypothetical protein [Microvirga sp. Mcv34]|uniref:hypothetical protein n=1 Tax=Microvirga sp. Mcv34 TaxID=2926016 RepID=UPI0021C5D8A2|nr:hypothetical protein [Microvirga sp. Mcv34]
MTPNQIERVAQAFYATEHPGDWDDAPEALREEFRDLARIAISLAEQQTSHRGSSLIATEAFEAAGKTERAGQRWRTARVMPRSH